MIIIKYQPHKMAKNIQTIRRQQSTNCLSVFDHFVGLVLKGLNVTVSLQLGAGHDSMQLSMPFTKYFTRKMQKQPSWLMNQMPLTR